MHKRLVVHPVFPVKTDSGGILTAEQVVGIYRCILVAKESPHAAPFFGCDTRETLLGHLLVFLHQSLCDDKVLHPILSGILEMLGSDHPVILHRVAHL